MNDKSVVQYVDSHLRNYENVSPEEVVDYYKSLGDWQNFLAKTDYTYSPVSAYYKKKINGIYPVLPNMSRPSLWAYEFGYDTTEIMDNIINKYVEQHHLMHLRYLADSKTVDQKWTTDGKRSSVSQSSTFTHLFLLSIFIAFLLFSFQKFPFHF